jgi:monoterpene epsilon-lactone hydrolase
MLIELGIPVPGALFAGTPEADLSKTGDSYFINTGVDYVLVSYEGILEGAAKLYAGDHELTDPLISPVYGDFKGYLVSGTRDMFLSNTVRVHRKLRTAGVVAYL